MRIIADLHIHSPHARAVSKDMTLENLDHWARVKGITVMGTGDFTHPKWMKEIKEKLEPAEQGLYTLKGKNEKLKVSETSTRFMLTVEISSIYSKGGKVRRIHNLIFAPSIETAEKINTQLGWLGNLASDGRPILGLDSEGLAKVVFNVDPQAVIVPAHAWTPWFSVFGSMSGFDSIEECFGAFTPQIFAIETGLSSDPAMNWRLSGLDAIALISNSDSHSLQRIGREANVFDGELSYGGIMAVIRSHDPKRFLFTVEFFPEEGKYHYDGHSEHNVRMSPEETRKASGKCPTCGWPVTVGVMSRVEALADRPSGAKPPNAIPFKRMVPLDEIIGGAFGVGESSKKVKAEYHRLVSTFGSEFAVLLEAPPSDLKSAAPPEVAEGITRVREGRIRIEPGYDGEYGRVSIFDEAERSRFAPGQTSLFR
ncbi:MAG: DNA helicase UvrD [Candidatus Sungbacteria bacterium RIFCSPLOWO2_01_FULL_59_16]|uniref:DNA helicase UvrD n=1 Tax=Candidatus Sungbacteria bacterium RIFCSPLOWO2_01_FULL_59_16 TaxID=1802280 RepID=A0A1G2LE56_9BACT|nr:MAG: DNA helicase UvrD [Candidatus Sungbacteria bacterium RIFCSPLOWO2_01_FULL_59_16]